MSEIKKIPNAISAQEHTSHYYHDRNKFEYMKDKIIKAIIKAATKGDNFVFVRFIMTKPIQYQIDAIYLEFKKAGYHVSANKGAISVSYRLSW